MLVIIAMIQSSIDKEVAFSAQKHNTQHMLDLIVNTTSTNRLEKQNFKKQN